MSLHQRVRKLLFEEFIERNYQDVDKKTKKELLKISPDDILRNKLVIREYKDFQKDFSQALDLCLTKELSQASAQILKKLFYYAKPNFVSLWLFSLAPERTELCHSHGNIPKYIKQWNASREQINLIRKRMGKNLIEAILLKENEKEDFFGEVDLSIRIHPIVFQNKFQGFLLSSDYNPKVSLSKEYFNYFIRLFSMIAYLDSYRSYQPTTTSSQTWQSPVSFEFFKHLIKLDGIDKGVLEKLTKHFKTPQCLLAKAGNKEIKIISAYGIKSFEPFKIKLSPDSLTEGFLIDKQLALLNDFLKTFDLTGVDILLKQSDLKKEHWVFLINPYKKILQDESTLSFLIETIAHCLENK